MPAVVTGNLKIRASSHAISQERKRKRNADRRCVRHLRAVLPARDAPLSLSLRPLARERLRGGAPRLSAFHRGSRQRDASPKGSGPGQASWDLVSAGVTRGRLSQSSGSTPRTGRNAGEHDARTRPGVAVTSRHARAPRPVPINRGHRLTSFTANGINRPLFKSPRQCQSESFPFAIVQINRHVTRSDFLPGARGTRFTLEKIRNPRQCEER